MTLLPDILRRMFLEFMTLEGMVAEATFEASVKIRMLWS